MSDGIEDEPHSEYAQEANLENLDDNLAEKDSNKSYKVRQIQENVVFAAS